MMKRKIMTIEAIRGFAAIYVLLGHLVLLYQPYNYSPKFKFLIKTIFGYGHEAVLLFFIVSGFSIHYSSSLINFKNSSELWLYLYKRFKRIYPIFFISLLLALVVLFTTDAPSTWDRNILSFLFVTDIAAGSFVNPIPTNFPIWSLTYEVFYYLLYPVFLIGINRFGIKNIFFISLLISLLSAILIFIGFSNYFTNILLYYWIWAVGVAIANLKMNNKLIAQSYLKGMLLISTYFMFTFEKITIIRDWSWAFFFTLIILSFFSKGISKDIRNKVINFFIGSIGFIICYKMTFYDWVLFHPIIVRYLLVFLLLLSIVFVFVPITFFQSLLRFVLRPFVASGSYSYALYIIHWPLILLFMFFYTADNFFSLLAFILVNIVVIFTFSYLLQIKLQPKIARYLDKLRGLYLS